jgi:hypothetical protein
LYAALGDDFTADAGDLEAMDAPPFTDFLPPAFRETVNASQLVVGPCGVPPGVAAALRASPCHGFMAGVFCEASGASLADARAAVGGFRHLRHLAVVGGADDIASTVDAVAPTLRTLVIGPGGGGGGGARLDLGGCARLRRLEVTAGHYVAAALPASLAAVGTCFLAFSRHLAALDLSHTAVAALPPSFAAGCEALTSVLLPPTLTAIADAAFDECPALATLDLSGTQVAVIGDDFLLGGHALTGLRLPPALHTVGRCFLGSCFSLTVLDASLTVLHTVGRRFLEHCASLAALLLPATLRAVPADAHDLCRPA